MKNVKVEEKMKKGVFYAVGIGPGDPELLTIKAIKTIENSDVIVVPASGAKENMALKIAGSYIKGQEIVESHMPMTKDKEKLAHYHQLAFEQMCKLLDDGKVVSFLTLGDPTIYSTVMYVHRKLTEAGYDTKVVSGITSFCAAAASLNTSLCEREQILHIIPATFKGDEGLNLSGSKVLMKSGKSIMAMKEKLKGKHAMVVEKATMEDERVFKNLDELEEETSYFSIIVVPEEREE